ncbi:TPA: teichoic acid biosynthesis protein, partial [Listeria monocytogenes]|nr:teichoic acid biosynthesis protein [Listeria monocytogenes]
YKNKMAIEKNNYFWERLNNYFLSKLPEAKVIDFSKKGYIGDFNYPFGHSFSHFESPYYKDFLKELIYITKS